MSKAAALLAFSAAGVWAQVTAEFSDPSRPGTVRIERARGGVTISGAAIKNVRVLSRNRAEEPISIRESGNVLTIDDNGRGNDGDLVLQVPFATSAVVKTVNSGTIRIENLEGEIEASNVNGHILLHGVKGAVVADTVNGKIVAALERADPKPMSFITANGELDVTFPANLKATLRMKADNGDIYTEFEVTIRNEQSRVQNKRGQWRSETVTIGQVNGGGPEIRLQTLNGKIYIRKGR
ncbi:MAG: hypothetical protein SFV18_19080 [Bryobacteraceae bacterium]|nr:hypothetical protein [Bryobacteraceae bacterium]